MSASAHHIQALAVLKRAGVDVVEPLEPEFLQGREPLERFRGRARERPRDVELLQAVEPGQRREIVDSAVVQIEFLQPSEPGQRLELRHGRLTQPELL